MKLFYFNPEQMLIGKLKKNMFKPFHHNDKLLIEKNLKNILGLRLLYSDYVDENGKVIADTIGMDREGRLYLVGYKKSAKDNFLKRYRKQYEDLMDMRYIFDERVKLAARRDDVTLFRCRAVFIGSKFTDEEINASDDFPIPCDLYTWCLVGNILIFDKIEKKENKKP